MPEEKIRIVKKEEVLAQHMDMYIGNYRPWAPNADIGDKIREVFCWGSYSIDPEEAKKILQACEKGEEVFKNSLSFEDMKKIHDKLGRVVIAGKEYAWPIARAILSYFQKGKHLTYLTEFHLEKNERVV